MIYNEACFEKFKDKNIINQYDVEKMNIKVTSLLESKERFEIDLAIWGDIEIPYQPIIKP